MRYPKTLVFVLVVSLMGLVACFKENKGCEPLKPSEEDKRMQDFIQSDSIQNFLALNDLTVEHDPNGFYYIVVEPGNNQYPQLISTLTVDYTGTLTDFRVFDKSTDPVRFQLRSLIEGWQLGLPKIGKGGRIILILPPSLAYGCTKMNIIEENSVLVFDLKLYDFQN